MISVIFLWNINGTLFLVSNGQKWSFLIICELGKRPLCKICKHFWFSEFKKNITINWFKNILLNIIILFNKIMLVSNNFTFQHYTRAAYLDCNIFGSHCIYTCTYNMCMYICMDNIYVYIYTCTYNMCMSMCMDNIYVYIYRSILTKTWFWYICFLPDIQICKYMNVDGFFKQRYDTMDRKG